MHRSPTALLTALVYETGTGDTANDLVAEAVELLRQRGLTLAGMIQRQAARIDRMRCDLIGRDLGTGVERALSEDRGPAARGCRLDSRALEDLVGLTMTALDNGADVMFASRFGKREAQGAGFREAIGAAVSRGIPVLAPVHRDYVEAWREFGGDLASEVSANRAAVQAWCDVVSAAARPISCSDSPEAARQD